jgi:hypothetical protein
MGQPTAVVDTSTFGVSVPMLFMAVYRTQPSITAESQRRALRLFSQWQPPAGFTFKAHYTSPDGVGYAVVEADNVGVLVEGTAPFTAYLDFTVTPIMDIMEAVPLLMRADAWTQSIS